ncbi:hypothetical protein BJY04DRAFT_212614 [Aspergillus karnatakaensis]|uniref:uncharacterized protein n=1 Tax=Aspergillus karnatakaensis TaxID=1810916 RepID=UPI003CCE2CD6
MHLSKQVPILGAAGLSLAIGATALWDCRSDQHVFPIDTSKFLVHFTSTRDSNYNARQTWIRICLPNNDGTWTNVDPLGLSCAPKGDTFSGDQTGLGADITVVGGEGCSLTGNGLNGASISYKDQAVNLQYGGDACGPRSHGITCQFAK